MANSAKGAYSALGSVFELLNDDCGYVSWSQYLIQRIREKLQGNMPEKAGAAGSGACSSAPAHGKAGITGAAVAAGAASMAGAAGTLCGLDLGCGNGYFTRAFAKAGYAMTGLDISLEMLSAAEEAALKEGIRAQFVQGDVTSFRVPQKADFALAINDCFNYIPGAKLKKAFRHVHDALKRGGVFIFDITAPEALLAQDRQVYLDDRDDVTCIWYSEVQRDTDTDSAKSTAGPAGNAQTGDSDSAGTNTAEALVTDVTVFAKNVKSGKDSAALYTRRDERQTRYIHTDEDIQRLLTDTGFAVQREELPPDVKGRRLNYICTRL